MPFSDLNDAIEPIYRIPRLRIGQECFLLNHLNLATILAKSAGFRYDCDETRVPRRMCFICGVNNATVVQASEL